MNYQQKYLKYKGKYLNLKNQIGGVVKIDIHKDFFYNNPIKSTGTSANKSISTSANCGNDVIDPKQNNEYRFLLLDINEFIKTCNTVEYNENIFIDYINSSNADIGLLLNFVPKLNYNDILQNIRIFNHNIVASNDINKLLGSGIFSKDNVKTEIQYDLPDDNILIGGVYNIQKKDILILLAVINNKTNITTTLKELDSKLQTLYTSNKYIILSGLYGITQQIFNNFYNIDINNNEFYVSDDFIEDFYFTCQRLKSPLTDNLPIILDIKNIDTKIKKFESEIKFIFNQILLNSIDEKFLNYMFFCESTLRGYYNFYDSKYHFDNNCIEINNNISPSDKSELFVIINQIINKIISKKNYLTLIVNLFNHIKSSFADINTDLCVEELCTFINDPINFTDVEVQNINNFIKTNTNKPDVDIILNKYIKIEQPNPNTIIVKMFGLQVLTVNFSTTPIDENLYYKINKNVDIKIHLKNPSPFIKKFLEDKDKLSYKYREDPNPAANDFKDINVTMSISYINEINTNADDIFIEKNVTSISTHGSQLQYFDGTGITFTYSKPNCRVDNNNILYLYTEYFSNLTDSLHKNEFTNIWTFKKDDCEIKTNLHIKDVVDIFDPLFANVVTNSTPFNVYRATNAIKLIGFDNFDLIGLLNNNLKNKTITIPYYTSTTINKNAYFYMAYTDIIFPIIMDIEIPANSHVLCLGDPYGQIIQSEVLLKRNYTLTYQDHSWKNIPYYKDRTLEKATYGLVIKFKYAE